MIILPQRIESELVDSIEDSLKRGMCKIRNGIKYFSEDEIIALDAYAHEWTHSVSNKTVFEKDEQLLKDILTEYVARSLVSAKTGIKGSGGYDDEMDRFFENKKEEVNSASVLLYLKSENIDNIKSYFTSLLKDGSKIKEFISEDEITVSPNKRD